MSLAAADASATTAQPAKAPDSVKDRLQTIRSDIASALEQYATDASRSSPSIPRRGWPGGAMAAGATADGATAAGAMADGANGGWHNWATVGTTGKSQSVSQSRFNAVNEDAMTRSKLFALTALLAASLLGAPHRASSNRRQPAPGRPRPRRRPDNRRPLANRAANKPGNPAHNKAAHQPKGRRRRATVHRGRCSW